MQTGINIINVIQNQQLLFNFKLSPTKKKNISTRLKTFEMEKGSNIIIQAAERPVEDSFFLMNTEKYGRSIVYHATVDPYIEYHELRGCSTFCFPP